MSSPAGIASQPRALGVWRAARSIAGGLVIVSALALMVRGVTALSRNEDASRAMKVPFVVALVSLWLLVRSVTRLRERQAATRQKQTPPTA